MSDPTSNPGPAQGTQPDPASGGVQAENKSADEMRQGETGLGARKVLVVSLIAAFIAVALVLGLVT